LSKNLSFNAATLPYTQEVLDYVQAEKENGRRIILATAADELVADQVAAHLGLFDGIIASTPGNNLKGQAKLDAIRDDAGGEFEYLGNDTPDLPIWKDAARVGIVNAPSRVKTRAMKDAETSLVVEDRPSTARGIIKAMRPHQWAKNVLVLLPLFFSHSYMNPGMLGAALLAMAVFSMCASAIYIINDLLDIEADRKHTRKRHRPFAAGTLSPKAGLIASAGLLVTAFAVSLSQFNPAVTALFALYILTTTLYSTWFKHKAAIDIVVLTCLYALRIFVGGVVIGVIVSPSLLNFSLFFFASLALMKRFTEIQKLETSKTKEKIRGYYLLDNQTILPMGVTAGGLAVLTLTQYFGTEFVAASYGAPELLWLTAPLVLFWIFRAWLLAMRAQIDDDPVVFALRDKISRTAILMAVGLVIAAKFLSIEGLLV
jgi:4-hydroxybenzoate polyprenyltransferase